MNKKPSSQSVGSAENKIRAAFATISKTWLAEFCELFPEQASKLGFREYEPLLGRNSPDIHRKLIALLERTLSAVESLPEAAFRSDDWLDRRGLLARLRTDLLAERDLLRWRTNPQTHSNAAIDAIFELVVRYSGKLRQALPAIESRLEKIPAFLRAGLECVEAPDPLWTSLGVQSCAGAVEFLQGLENELACLSKNPVQLASTLHSAVRAFEEYAAGIAKKPSGPKGGFAIGRERFEFLIREQLGLDLSLPEARALGEYEVQRHEFLLERAARRHGRQTAREIIERAAAGWTPEFSLLEIYRKSTIDIRARLETLGLVTIPTGDRLEVLPVPPFLRHQFPTAAYSAPEPFSRDQKGIFWVNDLSLGLENSAKKLAEIRQHHGLELTTVHEAYPGHHLQFVVQFQHPSRLRRLFAHSIFYEGWTMWCEKLAVEHGLVDIPGADLIQLHDALWRAHRIVIDCGLHDGTLSHASAAKRLQKGVGFTGARAKADVNWYTSSPTVPMSYLLGRLEVEKLHRRLVSGLGWSLKKFNDWMLSYGAIPYSWICRV
ncbi:MAG: DUF885 domain-containing protein [bacterium]